MPRDPVCFILRHGQTEWSEQGKRTSFTDLSLTDKGAELVKHSKAALVGPDSMRDWSDLLTSRTHRSSYDC
ncbi:hypothetical protein MRB53_039595 [Persea americana]|nr:hypothetical protein MRB53_039595 [Persea americana]